MARRLVRYYVMGSLVWDYTETVLNLVSHNDKTKKLSRSVRQLRREYDQGRAAVLKAADVENEARLAELFEQVYYPHFNRLCNGLKAEMGKDGPIEPESLSLVMAVQMVMTLLDVLDLLASECEKWVESFGVKYTGMFTNHFRRLAILMPEFAGDLYRWDLPSRSMTAKILYNEITQIDVYDMNGKL